MKTDSIFQVEEKSVGGLNILNLKNLETKTEIEILPEHGALWHAWIIQHQGADLNLIDNYADLAELKADLRISHKSAKLSPFACRLADGKYTFKQKTYEFANKFKDGTAIHGLLVDKKFTVEEISITEDSIAAHLLYRYRQDDPAFPFDYDCRIAYQLFENGQVGLKTTIVNVGVEEMPLVDGWHPYFKTGTPIDQCLLQFDANQMMEFDERLIPTGKMIDYTQFERLHTLKDIQLDNSFLLDTSKAQPQCRLIDPIKKIELKIIPQKNYPILQIYTPLHRQSIAIENLSGSADAFNNHLNLIHLYPYKKKEFAVTYSFKHLECQVFNLSGLDNAGF